MCERKNMINETEMHKTSKTLTTGAIMLVIVTMYTEGLYEKSQIFI